jgi:hypothetical protein
VLHFNVQWYAVCLGVLWLLRAFETFFAFPDLNLHGKPLFGVVLIAYAGVVFWYLYLCSSDRADL